MDGGHLAEVRLGYIWQSDSSVRTESLDFRMTVKSVAGSEPIKKQTFSCDAAEYHS